MKLIELVCKGKTRETIVSISDENIRMDSDTIKYRNTHKRITSITLALSMVMPDVEWQSIEHHHIKSIESTGRAFIMRISRNISEYVYLVDIDHPKMGIYKSEFRDIKLRQIC